MKPALAIDFDGTVTEDATFPEIGCENLWVDSKVPYEYQLNPEEFVLPKGFTKRGNLVLAPATYVIQKLASRFEIIFHTCRTGLAQRMMIDWLAEHAFCTMHKNHDYYINHNPYCPEAHEKPFADVYLDNRGLTWHDTLHVEDAIVSLMNKLPVHDYIPQNKK